MVLIQPFIYYLLISIHTGDNDNDQKARLLSKKDCQEIINMSYRCAIRLMPEFLSGLEAKGWLVDAVQFNVDEWRSVWSRGGIEIDPSKTQ